MSKKINPEHLISMLLDDDLSASRAKELLSLIFVRYLTSRDFYEHTEAIARAADIRSLYFKLWKVVDAAESSTNKNI